MEPSREVKAEGSQHGIETKATRSESAFSSRRWLGLVVIMLVLLGVGVGTGMLWLQFSSNPASVPTSPTSPTSKAGSPTRKEPGTEVVPPTPIKFAEMADAAGLHYAWKVAKHPTDIYDGVGQGCAFLDVNNDGNLDILLVGPTPALYLGDGKGHFTDVTAAYGLADLKGQFCGCCVGDYDNDGYDDIYLSGYHTGLLLHNEGGKSFRDVTKSMGLLRQRWGTSCAFVDVDGDGKLDLFIANYVDFDPKTKPYCVHDGIEGTCGPLDYKPVSPTLYLNRGDHFEDVTSAWLVTSYGGNLGVACADYDGSGRQSIAVANDLRYGDFFVPVQRPDGRPAFENRSTVAGVSGEPQGIPHAGMGIDWGDVNNDGMLDLVVVTFQHEPRSLYINNGDGTFADVGMDCGINQDLDDYLPFGTKFVDVDNDGWLDLLIANGHVQDNIAKFEPKTKWRQNTRLHRNHPPTGTGGPVRLDNITAAAGLSNLPTIIGRGLAIGDFDNDGRMDALVTDLDGPPQLLHNVSQRNGHWLLCSLVGTKSNRDGYGALVTFTVGGRKLLRQCGADGSYLSSSDKRVHVGLGSETHADIRVRWPSGRVSELRNVPADQIVTLKEP